MTAVRSLSNLELSATTRQPPYWEVNADLEEKNSLKPVPKGLYILDATTFGLIYGDAEREKLAHKVDFYAPPQTSESIRYDSSLLREVEVIFSGWGAPLMDEAFLDAAPNLKAVFYGAGSVRSFVTDSFWKRKIVLTSGYAANATPVAEYVLGTVLLSLKNFWRYSAGTRLGEGWGDHTRQVLGNFRSTVGMVSCGMVARKALELLKAFDLQRIVYCPYLSKPEADELAVGRRSLEAVFREADVVSLHTPDLPQTRGLVNGNHFASMKLGATFINTARGAVVHESEMIEVLRSRSDLTAILDVCQQEPPEPNSPLLNLPNVILTPHIAGSLGSECGRLGRFMVEEFDRFLAGEPLRWQIDEATAARLA